MPDPLAAASRILAAPPQTVEVVSGSGDEGLFSRLARGSVSFVKKLAGGAVPGSGVLANTTVAVTQTVTKSAEGTRAAISSLGEGAGEVLKSAGQGLKLGLGAGIAFIVILAFFYLSPKR